MSPQMKSLQDVRLLAGGELSLKARLGYVALLLIATAMSTVVVSLGLTEAILPLRTQLAFGAMSLIGAAWAGFAAWTLAARRPLFARDRVVAGWLAVAFTSVFVAGAIAAVVIANNAASYAVSLMGVVMLVTAVRILVVARRRFADLLARRVALEA
jgi:hypothetical protein